MTDRPTGIAALRRLITRPVLYLAGLYFTFIQRTYKVGKLEFFVPRDLTDVPFRGYFPIGRYEKEERKYLVDYLNRDAKVLELGACLGVVSGLTNSLLKNPEHHVVVEANPALIPWIEKNRDHNQGQYKVEHCIITDEPFVTFYLDDIIVLGSTKRSQGKPVQIPGKRIETLEAEHGFQFDTLVMDIEGGELDFFESNKDRLSQFRQVFMEVHPFGGMLTQAEVDRCEELLTQAGLKLSVRDGIFQIWEKVESASKVMA